MTTSSTSIPIMITKGMRRKLHDLGHSDTEIDSMKPSDAHEILDQQPSVEDIMADALASGSNEIPQEEPLPPTFDWLSFDDTLTLPPKEWLVDNIFGAGDTGMIYGQPGSAKTFVVIDLILACCTGTKFAVTDNLESGFDIVKPLSVAYCAGEGIAGLGQRFQAAAQRYGVTSLDNFYLSRIAPQLIDRNQPNEHIDNLISEWKQADKGQLDLLIIDTLHSATVGANENDAGDMGKALMAAKRATRELGCTVLLVHHTNKAGTGERGSSALRGAMDFMIEVGTLGPRRVIECSKLKDGEQWKPQQFDLVAMGPSVRCFWYPAGEKETIETDSDTIKTLLSDTPDERYTRRQIEELTGISTKSAEKYLVKLFEDGHIKREKNGRSFEYFWAE